MELQLDPAWRSVELLNFKVLSWIRSDWQLASSWTETIFTRTNALSSAGRSLTRSPFPVNNFLFFFSTSYMKYQVIKTIMCQNKSWRKNQTQSYALMLIVINIYLMLRVNAALFLTCRNISYGVFFSIYVKLFPGWFSCWLTLRLLVSWKGLSWSWRTSGRTLIPEREQSTPLLPFLKVPSGQCEQWWNFVCGDEMV